MIPVLADSNVILDVATDAPVWAAGSADVLWQTADATVLVINPLIYAEVSIGYTPIEDVEAALADGFRRDPLPWEAAFLAGKCFSDYRHRGGDRRSPLPDFYIGAHAAVAGFRLLTRDVSRYRSYFPSVSLIHPTL